jgi:hypothetical protein
MEAQTPIWQKALPFVALVPMALVPNGSLISLGIVLVTLVLVKASRGPTLAFWGTNPGRDLALGIGAGVILWALSHFLMDPMLERLFGRIDLDNLAAVRGNLSNYLMLLALGLVYGGVIEELLNRGFVIGWGTAMLGERAAIPLVVLSSAVFGLAHLYQDWSGVISAGVTGLALGGIYLATGRKLLAPMLAHAAADAIGITSLYLGHAA